MALGRLLSGSCVSGPAAVLGRAGWPGALNRGYLLDVIGAASLVFLVDPSHAVGRAVLVLGHGCFGEPGGVAALSWARAWAPSEDIFPLAGPGARQSLAEGFAFVLSAFPSKEPTLVPV